MTKRTEKIQTHFASLIVRVRPAAYDGTDIYRTKYLDPEAGYKVLATYMHRFGDGSTEPCFMLQGPDNAIIKRACTQFQVAELDGQIAE